MLPPLNHPASVRPVRARAQSDLNILKHWGCMLGTIPGKPSISPLWGMRDFMVNAKCNGREITLRSAVAHASLNQIPPFPSSSLKKDATNDISFVPHR